MPIVNNTVNAVTMTVLPDAPVDSATGLKVPTIAVATNGGLSLIQNTGTVRNSSSTLAFTQVTLTPQLLSAGRADAVWYYAANPGSLGASFALTTKNASTATDFNAGNTTLLKAKDRKDYARTSGALVQLLRNNEGTIGKGVAAKLSDTYNTGWLAGDIRRAYLANSKTADRSYKGATATETGTVTSAAVNTGNDLVAYSGFSAADYIQEPFSADLDFGTGEWSVGAWVNVPTGNATAATIAAREGATGAYIRIGIDATNKLIATAYDGTTTRTVTTTAAYNRATWLKAEAVYKTDGSLAIFVNGQEVAVTRGNPLLTMNSKYNLLTYTEAWATSPWGSQYYSVVANNAGTDPLGGNTASKVTFTSNYSNVGQSVATVSGASYTFSFWAKWLSGNTSLKIRHYRSATGNNTSFTPTSAWQKFTVTVLGVSGGGNVDFGVEDMNSSGFGEILVWGAQVELGSNATTYQRVSAATDFDFQAPLTIGNNYALDAPFPGSIALLKLSASVPTAEQATWMYEQEKHLFSTGAKCVLPASTSVLDLAYDDATDTWSTLQATYESSFSGLVRTATQTPSAGSFSKVAEGSGVKLLGRTTTNPGVDVQMPAKNLRSKDMPKDTNQDITVFDFDAVTSQTDFVLPVGYTARVVYSAGAQKRIGSTKDYTVLFDGFRETVRFGTAPGNGVWVQIHAVKEVSL